MAQPPQFRLIPPANLNGTPGHWAHRPLERLGGYLQDAGLTIDDLFTDPDRTFTQIADQRSWEPTTVALYRKAARHIGIPTGHGHCEPDTPDVPTAVMLDRRLDITPALLRTGVWLALAHHRPEPVTYWVGLTIDQARQLVRTRHAADLLDRWTDLIADFGHDHQWALPTLRSGPHGSRTGGPCAERTLRVWFRRRAQAAALIAPPQSRTHVERLTYDRYRVLRLADGATSARGQTRQQRSRHTQTG